MLFTQVPGRLNSFKGHSFRPVVTETFACISALMRSFPFRHRVEMSQKRLYPILYTLFVLETTHSSKMKVIVLRATYSSC